MTQNPMANPFNTRWYGNYNANFAQQGRYFSTTKDPNSIALPDPIPYQGQTDASELHTPCQEVPSRNAVADWNRMSMDYSRQMTWDDRQIYSLGDENNLRYNQGLSRKDIEYWNNANIESEKLSSNMSQQQKDMLSALQQSGFFDSKLIDESLRK